MLALNVRITLLYIDLLMPIIIF